MNEILDFNQGEDIDLRKIKFHGKLAGKGWQYERVIANLEIRLSKVLSRLGNWIIWNGQFKKIIDTL